MEDEASAPDGEKTVDSIRPFVDLDGSGELTGKSKRTIG